MNKIKVHTSLIGTTGYNNHVRDFLKPLNKLINFFIICKRVLRLLEILPTIKTRYENSHRFICGTGL